MLTNIPIRTNEKGDNGLTMMMDKGLSIREAENFLLSNCEYTEIIKLGFGTSMITPNINDKIKLYQDNGILVYAGGTLFEAFAIRDQLDDYKKYMCNLGLEMVEISDGSTIIEHERKCQLISEFSEDFRVISEIGSKDSSMVVNSEEWITWMQNELDAGSWKVITEARESGNVGIFDDSGMIKEDLIDDITEKINIKDILWEAPNKNQQVWLINKFGANVNLGNIAHNDIIPLECLRLGLRGDTFHNSLK